MGEAGGMCRRVCRGGEEEREKGGGDRCGVCVVRRREERSVPPKAKRQGLLSCLQSFSEYVPVSLPGSGGRQCSREAV